MLEGQTKRTVPVFIGSCDGKEANRKATSKPLGIWASSKVMVVAMWMALAWVLVLDRSSFGCTSGLVTAESCVAVHSLTHFVRSFQARCSRTMTP